MIGLEREHSRSANEKTFAGIVISYVMFINISGKKDKFLDLKNPFKLKSAIMFGVVFAVVIFISKAAQIYLGNTGIYRASALGGLTSIDAMVISLT